MEIIVKILNQKSIEKYKFGTRERDKDKRNETNEKRQLRDK